MLFNMSSPAAGAGIAKVLVVGDVATGKTSVIRRYVRNQFSHNYQTTIGVDFALKRVHTEEVDINVQLWDIAGQERFSGLSRIFYTHAVGAVIVYDMFSRRSFENVIKWKNDIDAKVFLPSGSPIPVLLLGNKCDLEENSDQRPCHSDEELAAFVKNNNFFQAYKCSALSGANIKEGFHSLISQIARNNKEQERLASRKPEAENDNIRLGDTGGGGGGSNSGGSCC